MDREIQVLYTIFQLELKPPFNFVRVPNSNTSLPFIYNKFSENIGTYTRHSKLCFFYADVSEPIQKRIKKVFNATKLSDTDVYHIAKHLLNWLQDNFPEKVEIVEVINYDTGRMIFYPYEI